MSKRETPIKAIRAYCLRDCCAGHTKQVRFCTRDDCALYPYRMGKRPQTESEQEDKT